MVVKHIFSAALVFLMVMDLVSFGFLSGVFFATWKMTILILAGSLLVLGSFLAVLGRNANII